MARVTHAETVRCLCSGYWEKHPGGLCLNSNVPSQCTLGVGARGVRMGRGWVRVGGGGGHGTCLQRQSCPCVLAGEGPVRTGGVSVALRD